MTRSEERRVGKERAKGWTVPARTGTQRKKVTVPGGVGRVPVTYAVSWTSVPVGGAPPQLDCVVTVGVSCTRKKHSALLSVSAAGRYATSPLYSARQQ